MAHGPTAIVAERYSQVTRRPNQLREAPALCTRHAQQPAHSRQLICASGPRWRWGRRCLRGPVLKELWAVPAPWEQLGPREPDQAGTPEIGQQVRAVASEGHTDHTEAPKGQGPWSPQGARRRELEREPLPPSSWARAPLHLSRHPAPRGPKCSTREDPMTSRCPERDLRSLPHPRKPLLHNDHTDAEPFLLPCGHCHRDGIIQAITE